MNARRFALALILVSACDGAETGNGASLNMRATQSGSGLTPTAEALLARDASGASMTLSSATLGVSRVDFDKPGAATCPTATGALMVHCDSAKIRIESAVSVDLLTGVSTPSFEDLVIPAGTYKKIEVRFDMLVASGTIDYRGTVTPYDLRLVINEDAKFESAGGVVVGTDPSDQVLMLLDVTQWFSSLPLTECLDDGDLTVENGRIAIANRGMKCSMVEKALKDAIKASSKLAKGKKD